MEYILFHLNKFFCVTGASTSYLLVLVIEKNEFEVPLMGGGVAGWGWSVEFRDISGRFLDIRYFPESSTKFPGYFLGYLIIQDDFVKRQIKIFTIGLKKIILIPCRIHLLNISEILNVIKWTGYFSGPLHSSPQFWHRITSHIIRQTIESHQTWTSIDGDHGFFNRLPSSVQGTKPEPSANQTVVISPASR